MVGPSPQGVWVRLRGVGPRMKGTGVGLRLVGTKRVGPSGEPQVGGPRSEVGWAQGGGHRLQGRQVVGPRRDGVQG